MLSQIFANALTGARTAHPRRGPGAERKGSFPSRLSGIFNKPDIFSGAILTAPPKRRPKTRRKVMYGTLFYLAGTALVGAVIVGICFGIGLYSLALSTDEAGRGFGALQAPAAASPGSIAAVPPASAPPSAAPDAAAMPDAAAAPDAAAMPDAVAAPIERPANQSPGAVRFAEATSELVSGRVVEAADAMTWVVANSTIRLWGIRPGPPGSEPLFDKFVDWARARSPLECHKHPHSSRYRCSTATGDDIAKAALLAGIGRAAEGATAAYRNAETRARRSSKSLWSGP